MALANGLSMDESRMLDPRWKFLSDLIDVNNQKGLEIGALTFPVVRSKDIDGGGQIFYLDHLRFGEKFSLEKDHLQKTFDTKKIMCLKTNGLFIDIGIPSDYEKAQLLLKDEI